MKKFLIVSLAALLLLSLTACGAPNTPQASGAANAEQSAPAAPSDGTADAPQPSATLFGKVKSLVGNELTLDLAKQPESEAVEGEDGASYAGSITAPAQSITITEEESAGNAGGGEAGGKDDVKLGYAAADGSGNVTMVDPENMPKLELEYTGETKDLTIPAGSQIFNMMGKEVKMADLKEGNVLMIMQNDHGSIASIAVME